MELNNFEQLKGKVQELLKQNIFLKEQNKTLSKELYQKNRDIQKLTGNIQQLHEERNLVRTKVVTLIGKLQPSNLSD